MKISVNHEFFLAYKNNVLQATMEFSTMEIVRSPRCTDDDFEDAKYYFGEYVAGETIDHPRRGIIILGPERQFTHEVTLRGYGNPDRGQYADIAHKKTVKVCGIEEAVAALKAYQDRYDMGGGNTGPQHGVVYELGAKKRKKVGRITYGGRFLTNKEWKAVFGQPA